MASGVIRTYYEDDNENPILYEEYFQINGIKEGYYKKYYDNGKLWK